MELDYGDRESGYWYYEYEGRPGSYQVIVEACDGAQRLEEAVDVEPTNECQDKDEVTELDVTLEPC